MPCQDTPSFRQTYTAEIDVPSDLRAVMAAAPASASVEREVRGNRVVERFVMPQPIPPYLFAFAVGELAARALSARSRVWTEPAQLEAAAWEFADVEAQMASAESLLGPYDWERFDLLVLPPSFPFGGMENPRLTFLTPTLLAGDRSLVNVVAHELAHSWTGNLVTNVNAEHFWLNEGFTVFAERRILEAIEGPEMGALHAAVGFQKLLQAIEQHREHPELTRLRTHLDGVDPDQAFSLIPYEKGYLFLKTLEAAAGRSAFDALLAAWLSEHRFGAADTDAFLVLVERMVPGLLGKVDADAWVNRAGLPSTYWKPESARLDAVQAVQQRVPTAEESKGWTAIEWHLYLEALPRPAPTELCASLDAAHSLSTARNPEVRVSWLTLACASGNAAVLPHVEELLGRVGRIKYLKPLYGALAGRPETAALARTLFSRYRSAYHPIAQEVIAALLA